MKTEDYFLLGIDLTSLETLSDVMKHIGVNTSQPTMFLSEFALAYMPASRYCDTFCLSVLMALGGADYQWRSVCTREV